MYKDSELWPLSSRCPQPVEHPFLNYQRALLLQAPLRGHLQMHGTHRREDNSVCSHTVLTLSAHTQFLLCPTTQMGKLRFRG